MDRYTPPNTTTAENQTLLGPEDFSGNSVVEKIAPGQYASYAHMQTGSISVKVGQHVQTGQVIGLLGNSGNTTAPHLHFAIINGPDFLTSDSLPFAISSFTVQGTIGAGSSGGKIIVVGKPYRATLSEPLVKGVFDFGN